MKYVRWIEQDENGNAVVKTLTIEEAIAYQRKAALTRGYTYEHSSEALEDFLTVHWGYIGEE